MQSPILHFVKDDDFSPIHSPNLIFEEEEEHEQNTVSSPILIFEAEVEPEPENTGMEPGTFHLEDVDFCSFVLSRGQRKGEMCCKISTQSGLLEREVPACIQHLAKYEEKTILDPFTFLSSRPAYAASYIEYELPEPPSQTTKRKKTKIDFSLDSIPKAIDRNYECTVCFEEQNPLLLPCGHTVCFDCTTKLRKDECPLCRDPFKKNQLRKL